MRLLAFGKRLTAGLVAAASLGAVDLRPAVAQSADNSDTIATHAKRVSAQILPTPVLSDSPKSDFEHVAWCHGALSGHMELAERIHSDDEVMRTIGKAYLKAYEAALTLSEEGKTEDGKAKAEVARKIGYDGWDTVRRAAPERQTGAYINWILPGECERAAIAVSGHPDLFKEMEDAHESRVIADTLKPFEEHKPVKLSALEGQAGLGQNGGTAGGMSGTATSVATSKLAPSTPMPQPAAATSGDPAPDPQSQPADPSATLDSIATTAQTPEARDAKAELARTKAQLAKSHHKTRKSHSSGTPHSGLRGKT